MRYLILFLCSTALLARSTLTVRVREAFSGAPVENARVQLEQDENI